MNDTTQAQLDAFARKLSALTAQFEILQREVGRTPAPRPVPAPPPQQPTMWPRRRSLYSRSSPDRR